MPDRSKKREQTHQSQLRRIQFWPNIYYFKLFVAYCFIKITKKGTMATHIIKQFFDSMPQKDRDDLIKKYNYMTYKQRLNPGAESEDDEMAR